MISSGEIQGLRIPIYLFLGTMLGCKLFSADQYWDIDDGSEGASTGSTANGNWNASNWNSNSDGSGSNGTWSNGNTAIFSAGTDATGSSTITADLNSMTLGGLTVEEGDITIASGSGSLTLSGSADFNVAEGSTLTMTEPLLYGGNTLNKTGKGLLTIGGGVGGTTTIEQGKIDIANGVNLSSGTFTGTSGAGSSNKSIIGGLGTVSSITIGDSNNEIDFIAPGLGYSSSLSSASSQKQKAAERSTGAVGTFTTGILNWNSGGVYDWEVKTFTPGTTDGAYDVLAFTTIHFEASQTFNINVMSVSNDAGVPGAVTNLDQTMTDFTGTGGFKFLSGTNVNGMGGNGDVSDRFNIRSDDFYYTNNNWMGDWGVWRDGGDFYLTYSVAPEPSTYIMISALFLVIGVNQSSRKTFRSIIASVRKKFSKNPKQPVPVELK